MCKLCASLGSTLNHHELEAALILLDENQDGVISLEEFIHYWQNRDLTIA